MKKIFLFSILILLLGFLFLVNVYAENEIIEEKIIAQINDETKCPNNQIIIILKNNESIKLLDYDNAFFNEIECLNIIDLTEETKNIYRKIEKNDYSFISEEYDIKTQLDITSFHQVLLLETFANDRDSLIESIRLLESRNEILYVGPNTSIFKANTPNDCFYNSYIDNRWAYEKIKMPEAWDIETSSKDVLVGIMDTGILADHADLTNNIYPYYHMDFSGDIPANNPVSVNNLTDLDGHGTLISGIIGAEGNNSQGVVGVCWNTYLVSLKVFEDNTGATSTAGIINALDYAVSKNIKVLNFSGDCDGSPALTVAVGNYPGLIICAAGNEGINCDMNPTYPSNYLAKNIICVGNSDFDDHMASDSNYGLKTVDLFAPGESIFSTAYFGGYIFESGTSFSAPFVTGVAALIYGLRPEFNAYEVKNVIMNSVDSVAYLVGKCVSNGRLNAYKALKLALEPRTFNGDVNGDGYEDVILSRNNNGTRTLQTFLGNSSGLSSTAVTSNMSNNYFDEDRAFVGDFNGDGRTDVLIHWESNNHRQLLVYKGNSNGTFSNGVNLSSTRWHDPVDYPCRFLVSDKNGDGKDDFIVIYRNSSGNIGVLVYSGTSSSPYLLDATSTALSSSYQYSFSDICFSGDFNGDGSDDILIHKTRIQGGTIYRKILIFKSLTSGYSEMYLNSSRTYYPFTNPSKFCVGDINNDGKDDFIVYFKQYGYYRYALTCLGKSSSPLISEASSYSLSSTEYYEEDDRVFVGKINGDGYADLVVCWNNDGYRNIDLYKGKSNGSFNARINLDSYYLDNYKVYPYEVLLLDVNYDGKKDIVVKVMNAYNNISFLVYNGSVSGFVDASSYIDTNVSYFDW